ncbi:NAD-dependent epimerase/dehydratase family protein [Kineosporia sp. NBRC 101731]|uniref:NAD-dependent epimerase/dehydratase family protein n=1 Tax=Kineosporia sp. NBRC 101731 TaxID=3032199 RepID=UPI0024A2E1BF|nr:NAD-dependent epimerase/dehydratase family protein [Kineosporia sp. NBRC 101731]GLY28176.1 nucleoside-diphosphate sugar epimerase [Kineosporia sp. NBRC 101731]
MKILVTGASGMLGGGVARKLAERGDDVTVLQRRPSSLAGVREINGDITDASTLLRAVEGMDAVVHLAAKVNVIGPWAEYQAVNVDGVRHLVTAMQRAGTSRLVHVSSPSVSHGGVALIGEGAGPADPEHARGNYARSKAAGELLALAADSSTPAVVAVRPHLVWGPGDTQLVGRIVQRARQGRLPLIGSGAALIDTTYVDNAVDATVAALDRIEVAHGRALVVTNGEPRPVADLFARLCDAAGVPAPTRRIPFPVAWAAGAAVEGVWTLGRRRDDPPLTRFLAEQLATAHWFDQSTTRAVLGWTPAVSLEEGFERMAQWYARR